MSSLALLLASTTPCFFGCTPEGPDAPFGSPLLAVADTVRVLCVIIGVAVILVMPHVLRTVDHWGEALRFAALTGFYLVSIDSRLEHIGDYPSVRMVFDVAAVAAGGVGVWSYLYREGQRRRDNPGRRDP